MIPVGGLLFTLVCVFGGFTLSGGSISAVMNALPFELLTICGAAIGSFAMANSMHILKATLRGLKAVIGGARYRHDDYIDLLSLLYRLTRLLASKGAMAIESHIENPAQSSIFADHAKILRNAEVIPIICDYFRMIGMDADDPHQVEDVMRRELKKTLVEKMHPVHALQAMADGLPALGIIAAVLGVIKTMTHINEPPMILGEMIGGALVGTFLGVLLAYCLVGPIAGRMKQVIEEEARYLEVIRATVVSHLHGNPPQVSIETGRKMVPTEFMPSFVSLEATLEQARAGGARA
ncbi:MAG TPA: flagellar motor stator protein MotA [Rhodopila sp.]|jgi:chemotaxis protein MotA|nr:flagellar motor stator protein MotA [Rhodopila sp.]